MSTFIFGCSVINILNSADSEQTEGQSSYFRSSLMIGPDETTENYIFNFIKRNMLRYLDLS